MNKDRWIAVDDYFDDLFAASNPELEAALQLAADAGLPPISIAPSYGKLLAILARSIRARSILEIGALGGYSAIWLARALPPEGRLITLEADPHHAEVAQSNLARAGLDDRAEVRVGRALDTLPQLAADPRAPFDLVFIDADKPGYPAYLDWALKLTRPGSLIIADNIVRNGAVVDANSADPNVQGVRRFNAALAAEPRLMAVGIQTVGAKGYDGLAIALVVGG